MKQKFNFDEALVALQSGQAISGKNGILAPLVKQLTEAVLEAELDSHLAQEVLPNRKNGKRSKTLKNSSGNIPLNTPRDRAGTFEPQLVKKNPPGISDEIETKILSMFSRGMSYADISFCFREQGIIREFRLNPQSNFSLSAHRLGQIPYGYS